MKTDPKIRRLSEPGMAILLLFMAVFAVATAVAGMRLYNDRHWLNDVIGGAGFGILSARVGYWLLPYERKLFRWDSRGPAVAVLPAYSPAGHTFSLSLAATF